MNTQITECVLLHGKSPEPPHWKYPRCVWPCHAAVSTGLRCPVGHAPFQQRVRRRGHLECISPHACADMLKWHVLHTNMQHLSASPTDAVHNRNTTQKRMGHTPIRNEQQLLHLYLFNLTFNKYILYTKMISESQGLHWCNLYLVLCTYLNNYTYKQLAISWRHGLASWRWCSNV